MQQNNKKCNTHLMLDKASIRRRPLVLQNECSDYQGPLETVWGTFLGTKNASKIPSHYFSIQAQCYGLVNGTNKEFEIRIEKKSCV